MGSRLKICYNKSGMKNSELKKALLGASLISKKDFESAEEKAKKLEKNIEDILIEKNLITEEDLAKKKPRF